MLTPKQLDGARFLAERRVAYLADKVGFGKTAQVVRACDLLCAERITVLCPPILRPNEVRQFEQWSLFGYPSAIIRTGKDPVPDSGLVVCSYQLAQNPRIKRKLIQRGCDVLMLDEAHRAKAPGSKTTKTIFNKAGIASTAARVWFVSGEPTPNNASELYVFARVCGAWQRTQDEFIRHFCIITETDFGPKILGTREDRRAELRGMLAPFMLQRDDVDPERAPLTVDELEIEGAAPDFSGIDPVALRRVTDALAAGDLSMLEDPFISTMRRLVGIAKARPVADLVRIEQEGGAGKTIVFCAHTDVIDTIASELREFYSIGYYPTTERTQGKKTNVKVRVTQPGLVVRARDIYLTRRPAK